MAAADNIIYVNTNTNSVTLTLPPPTDGRVFQVKDSTGNASVHNIILSPNTSEKIDGASSLTISDNYGFISLSSDGINWFTGRQTSITGNAATATALQTARTINGVSFDGTANITVAAAAGTLTGTTLASNVVSSSLTSVGTLANLTVTNPISGSVTGNAATATALQTGRTINGVTFDGTSNITVAAAAGTLTGTTLASNVVSSSLTSVGAISSGTWNGTTIAVNHGGTGVTSVTTTPAATSFAGWDANSNLSANSFIEGYATTATAAGTTTLTVASAQQQYFTGSTTQTVLLPVTSTLALGQSFTIVNNSSGVVTVQSSGANTIQAMAAGSQLVVTVILTSGTTAASWSANYATEAPVNAITALTGDVSASGPGSASATLASSISGAKTFSTSLTTPAFISSASNPASVGAVRLANADAINWRNAGNTADIGIDLNASNNFLLGSNLDAGTHNVIGVTQFLGAAGSASTPTYSFTGNGNVGMYDASGVLHFATNGTNAASVDASQNWTFSASAIASAFISSTANVASAGAVRLANADAIKFRNSGNAADISLTPGSTDNFVSYAGIDQVNISTAQTLTNKTISGASNTISSPIVGITTGSNPAAGQIGEQLISTVSTATNTAATATYFDATSRSITAGVWDVSGVVQYSANGATLTGGIEVGINTTTGNSNAGEEDTVNWCQSTANPNTTENQSLNTPVYRVALSGTTTYFLKGLINFSAGQPKYKATLRAVRVG